MSVMKSTVHADESVAIRITPRKTQLQMPSAASAKKRRLLLFQEQEHSSRAELAGHRHCERATGECISA